MAWQGMLPEGNPKTDGRMDLLIDLCLYFIAPHRFTPMDKRFLERLSTEVSVVPICAKADAMTDEEREDFQSRIRHELDTGKLQLPTATGPMHYSQSQ